MQHEVLADHYVHFHLGRRIDVAVEQYSLQFGLRKHEFLQDL